MNEKALTYKVPQFEKYTISIQKFTNVTNSIELRRKLAELPFAYIDAKTILSLEQLCSAIYKAILESEYNRMRTRSLHSECILSLSPSSNIGDALKRFGIKEDTDTLAVVKIVEDSKECPYDGNCSVSGELVSVSEGAFSSTVDLDIVKTVCYQAFSGIFEFGFLLT